MRWPTPRWWYERGRRRASATRLLLLPAAAAWAAVTANRIARARPFDPRVPVICVGGLTLGGTGKTPVVRELLDRLQARGIAAHALSRGYGGRLKGPLRVDPAIHAARDVGDEPLMLAGDHPVWISADRVAGAKAAVAAGARALVMDDGHQNPSLRKSLSLVVVDGETRNGEWPFGDGDVFPAGPMREPLAAGLARANAVVVMLPNDVAAPDQGLLALFGDLPVLVARLEPLNAPPAGPQLGFAGVGKPWKVERALLAAGLDLVDFIPLADHAELSGAALTALGERAARANAGLVTTEKDWVRLSTPWRERITPWPVHARFEDDAALDRLLDGAALADQASR
jgi:tetraacyldisaccharide 4'-kinase